MAQQKIYLQKLRDFGENLGDTFQFIRQELKPLLLSFFLIAGIFILGAAIASGIYQMEMSSVFEEIGRQGELGDSFFSVFFSRYLIILAFFLVAVAAMQTVIASYMKLYDLYSESPTVEQVWNEFRKHYLKILLLAIIKLIIYIPALMLCVAPGIYLMVVFAPMTWIVVNENASIGEAFSRCFSLVKENFWLSLGIYIVAYIIYSMAAGIIGLVLGIFIGIGSYMSTKEMDSTLAIVSSVTNVFSYFFYIVFAVSVGLNYYSLTEKLDGTGMIRRLDTLGSEDPNAKTEEQY